MLTDQQALKQPSPVSQTGVFLGILLCEERGKRMSLEATWMDRLLLASIVHVEC